MGQRVPVLKKEMDAAEFVRFKKWMELKNEERCKPTPDHYYIAKLISYTVALRTGKLEPLENFLIDFEIKGASRQPQKAKTPQEKRHALLVADNIAKQKMFAITGVPENFEGWYTPEPELDLNNDGECNTT